MVIVDDDDEMRLLVGAMLRIRLDADVVGEGANGDEAVELSARFQPDLLVLDHVMPGRRGGDAVAEIRQVSPDTCIVMFSATTTLLDLERTGDLPDRFVSKADGLIGLRDAVLACLAERRGDSSTAADWPPVAER